MLLEIRVSEFRVRIGENNFIAKHNDYTSYRNFGNYATKMLEKMWTSGETNTEEKDFLGYTKMFPITKGNKYFTKEQMQEIRLAIYYTKNQEYKRITGQ